MDTLRFKGARHAARIDLQVGDRIRKRRTLLGFTQEQLADALDISYQQIQKYETGANRVSAGRLFQIAQRLETPISFFFEGLGVDYDGEEEQANSGSNRTTIELVRNFSLIQDATVRNALSNLVKSLASGEQLGVLDSAPRSHDGQKADDHNGQNNGGNGHSHAGNGHSNGKRNGNGDGGGEASGDQ